MHFVQHGLREFLTRPRDYSPVVAKHLLFDPDGLLATAAFMRSNRRDRVGPWGFRVKSNATLLHA